MNVDELQEMLELLGLDQAGKKYTLVKRLQSFWDETEEATLTKKTRTSKVEPVSLVEARPLQLASSEVEGAVVRPSLDEHANKFEESLGRVSEGVVLQAGGESSPDYSPTVDGFSD